MPRTPKGSLPKLRLHKPSGRAVVTIRGKDTYCGAWGSAQARQKYTQLIAELQADASAPSAAPPLTDTTINEVVLDFLDWGEKHYRRYGEPTGELDNYKDAVGPLCQLYGETPAATFDASVAMNAIREHMIRGGSLCRTTINARINRLRRVIRYGVGKKWIPAIALTHVDAKVFSGLQAGRRDDVREPEKIEGVSENELNAVVPFMPTPVAAMARLIWLTTCRPEDAVIMRGRDLEFNNPQFAGDPNWYYRPGSHLFLGLHKNAWRGHERVIPIGPRAQELLRPFLAFDVAGKLLNADAFLFSPKQATAEHHAQRGRARRTKRYRYEVRRNRKRKPKRQPGDRYTVGSFRTAVKRACQKANVPEWTPNRLRHGRIDEVTDDGFGLEGANALAGHARLDTTQIYRLQKLKQAAQIAAQIG